MSVSFYFSRESLKARVWGLRAWVVPHVQRPRCPYREGSITLRESHRFCVFMKVSGERATQQVT